MKWRVHFANDEGEHKLSSVTFDGTWEALIVWIETTQVIDRVRAILRIIP